MPDNSIILIKLVSKMTDTIRKFKVVPACVHGRIRGEPETVVLRRVCAHELYVFCDRQFAIVTPRILTDVTRSTPGNGGGGWA